MPTASLHIVSGKGGTGKTTVAAALATALADSGRRILLCEVEGRQGIAQLYDIAPLPYEERRIAVGLGGGEVFALSIDPEQALLEYLQMYYRLGPAGRALDRFGVVDFATTIAPGVRDVLLTGKVYEAAQRSGAYAYDAIVMDAPPTGRITRFLNVNAEVAGLAKVGPIRRQAEAIMRLLRAEGTVVHLTTLLEEMPVTEALEAATELRGTGLPVGHVVANLVRPDLLSAATRDALLDGTLDHAAVAPVLARTTIDPGAAPALVAGGLEHIDRQVLQSEQRDVLASSGLRGVELPFVDGGIDEGALYDLAAVLRTDLLTGPIAGTAA